MSIAGRRAEVAAALTAGLTAEGVTVDPYQATSSAPFRGWIEVSQTDTQACTWGEVRLTLNCKILVATSRPDFENAQDALTAPLIAAVDAAGGRAVVVQPYTETVDSTVLYAVAAQFITEATTEG